MTATSGSEQIEFKPDSLKDVADAPVVWLKPMTGRVLPRYRHALRAAQLKYHGTTAFRDEMLVGLAKLWTPSDFDTHSSRLRAYWAAADALETRLSEWKGAGAKGDAPTIDLPDEEVTQVIDLQRRLADAWQPLATMAADNAHFLEESPRVALSMVLTGWSGIDVPFALEQGRVPMATIDRVETALAKIEQQARSRSIAVGADGTAFAQIQSRALRELNLGEDEEKN